MRAEELLKLKELLDNGAITQDEFEKQKNLLLNGPDKKKKLKSNLAIGLAVFFVFVICVSIIGGNTESTNDENDTAQTKIVNEENPDKPDEFSDECPISVSASVYDNIINFPELKCTFTNNSGKDISAVRIHFVPKDVYGEEIDNIFSTEELYTDETIGANATVSRTWSLLDQSVKSGDVYVYSVYFADGSEWGDRNASENYIKKYGFKVNALD